MNLIRPLAALATVTALASCATAAGSARPAAPVAMSVPAACHYLNLGHDGRANVPPAAALLYAAAHMNPDPAALMFGAIARRAAGDDHARTLRHLVQLGPDFAELLSQCGAANS